MIVVGWRCEVCGNRGKAFVAERAEGSDIKEWVDECGEACHEAHQLLSPGCQSRKVDLLLPVPDDAKFIGEKDNPNRLSDDLSEFDKPFKPVE